jgi:hypothetical protein
MLFDPITGVEKHIPKDICDPTHQLGILFWKLKEKTFLEYFAIHALVFKEVCS